MWTVWTVYGGGGGGSNCAGVCHSVPAIGLDRLTENGLAEVPSPLGWLQISRVRVTSLSHSYSQSTC